MHWLPRDHRLLYPYSEIKKTCRLWSLCAIKNPALPKFLHRRFTGIRWWNKGLIFIWQGSQSLARWSTLCSRPLSHNSLSRLHTSGLFKTTFRMHIVPCMRSRSNYHTQKDKKEYFFKWEVCRGIVIERLILQMMSYIGSQPYLHMSTSCWLFPFVIFLFLV